MLRSLNEILDMYCVVKCNWLSRVCVSLLCLRESRIACVSESLGEREIDIERERERKRDRERDRERERELSFRKLDHKKIN